MKNTIFATFLLLVSFNSFSNENGCPLPKKTSYICKIGMGTDTNTGTSLATIGRMLGECNKNETLGMGSFQPLKGKVFPALETFKDTKITVNLVGNWKDKVGIVVDASILTNQNIPSGAVFHSDFIDPNSENDIVLKGSLHAYTALEDEISYSHTVTILVRCSKAFK